MTRLWPLIVLVSCAHSPQSGKTLFRSHSQAKVREIPATSHDEARKVIGNHLTYLKLLFTQSQDPYFGTSRWSEECLAENIIGAVNEDTGCLESVSDLYLTPDLKPGACSKTEGATRWFVVYNFCQGDKTVREMKLPWTPELQSQQGHAPGGN